MNTPPPLPDSQARPGEISAAGGGPPAEKPLIPEIVIPGSRRPPEPGGGPGDPPLHILAALATVALDWVWFLVELPATISLAFIPTLLPLSLVLGVLDVAVVALVQHFLAGEPWGKAAAKGLAMGIIAGVPYPVFGTIIGVPLAAWAGIREVQKLLPPRGGG